MNANVEGECSGPRNKLSSLDLMTKHEGGEIGTYEFVNASPQRPLRLMHDS